MRLAAILMLVSLTGLTVGCNRQEPIPSGHIDARVDGVSPGHMIAVNPSILEDQRSFYTKHEAPPAAAPVADAATTTPATAPATAPATQP